MKVYFIGAGPGDPELITVKGQRLLSQCPVVLYAGSLVPAALLELTQHDAQTHNTAELHLEQIMDLIQNAAQQNLDVARLHSGDPSLYGAIGEQMRCLDGLNIEYDIIPGVTATSAAAATLQRELTLSGVSQTVILTRYAGKTPMPERERLSELARHGATLAIHLGVTRLHKIIDDLLPHYGAQCPVAVIYRATWPDEQCITGTLSDILIKVREKKINRTALILVGEVLKTQHFDASYLYQEDKAHIYRPKGKQRHIKKS